MVRLSRQSEISIGILVACARSERRSIRTEEAAAVAGASRHHAAHIVVNLAREGFVSTTRGRHGGIALARPACTILLGDVLRRVDPELTLPATGRDRALTSIFRSAIASFLHQFDRFTLADLAGDSEDRREGRSSRSPTDVAAQTAIEPDPQRAGATARALSTVSRGHSMTERPDEHDPLPRP